ncbi:MAG: hypothetical protein ABIR25_00075 [Sphingomicrobium sp.]
MAPKWSERPRTHRFAIVGAFIGMGIAAFVAFNYAYDSDTIIRYLIMSAGLLGGGGAGFGVATLSARR